MKRISFFFLCLFPMSFVVGQTEKFDIATFIPPSGWQRNDANGTLAFLDSKTENGLTSFCQIILYPSTISSRNASQNFKSAWQNLVTVPAKSNAKPVIQTDKTPEGWTVVSGSANINSQGIIYKSIVATITGFGKTMSVQVNTAGGNYASVLENFFNELNLDSQSTFGNNTSTMNVMIGLEDYEFIAPEKWQVKKTRDQLSIQNMLSGCLIQVLAPQTSSGNLEQDASAVFDLMYKGWGYQNSGDKKFLLAKGFLTKGQEYFMKEANMSGTGPDGRYNLEEGTAMVVKAGDRIVIIAARHNSAMTGHDDCYRNYNTWRRFFNSFTVKNISPAKNSEVAPAQRIPGLWKIVSSGVVSGDYVFAANGNYQHGGGIGSSTTSSDMYYEYIYSRAYPFQGDGSYSIAGDKLILKKRGETNVEEVRFRFEKVNHGGTGWKDRVWLLKRDRFGDNESLYEKKVKQ